MTGENLEYYPSYLLNAPTLAICPGMAEGPERFYPLKDALLKYFNLILFKQPGVAGLPLSEINIADIAQKNHQEVMKLGIESYNVLGHSLGGYVAQQMALDNPAEVNKLILVSTSCGSFKQLEIMEFMIQYSDIFKKNPEKAIKMLFHPSFIDNNPDEYNKFVAKRLLGDAATYFEYIKGGAKFSSFAQLKNIIQPTLVIHGDSDLVIKPDNAGIFQDTIRNCEAVVMSNTGHYPPIEKPTEFANTVTDFVLGLPVGDRQSCLKSSEMTELLDATAKFRAAVRKTDAFNLLISSIFLNPANFSVEKRLKILSDFIS